MKVTIIDPGVNESIMKKGDGSCPPPSNQRIEKSVSQSMQSVVFQNHAKMAIRLAPAKTDRMMDWIG